MEYSKVVNGFFGRNKAVFIMGLAALFIAGTADLFAGILLGSMEAYIMAIPGMLVLVYSAIGMRGNIFGAMGSRLGTSMHMGTFKMSFEKGTILRYNIESAIGLSFVISLAMGLIGWAVVVIFDFGHIPVTSFVFISLLGGLMASFILLGVNLMIARTGFKRDWDVDNITAPLIAAAGDIVTMPMLFICAWIVVTCKDQYQYVVDILTVLLIVISIIFIIYIFTRKILLGRADEAKRIVAQSTPILLMCLMLDIAAGVIIENQTDLLFPTTGVALLVLIIMMPAFLNEGNALSGMLTSRLSSMLHLGTLRVKRFPGKNAVENFVITYILAAITYAYIGVIAYIVAELIMGGAGNISFLTVMGIVLIAGMITTTALCILSYYIAVTAVRFDLDPDDHSIPVTSSSMDLIAAAVLISVIMLLV